MNQYYFLLPQQHDLTVENLKNKDKHKRKKLLSSFVISPLSLSLGTSAKNVVVFIPFIFPMLIFYFKRDEIVLIL